MSERKIRNEEIAAGAEFWLPAVERLERQRDGLLEALRGFLSNSPTMEDILWGDQPDDAPMEITVPFRVYRKARAAIASVESPGEDAA